jgi:hypothetical protein
MPGFGHQMSAPAETSVRQAPRGQLQRHVMTTIRVMACMERASLIGTCNKSDSLNDLSVLNSEPCHSSFKRRWDSIAGVQLTLRASNAGGLLHAITENHSKCNSQFIFCPLASESQFDGVAASVHIQYVQRSIFQATQTSSSESQRGEAMSNTCAIQFKGQAPRHHGTSRLDYLP